jgi:hypothetical protein
MIKYDARLHFWFRNKLSLISSYREISRGELGRFLFWCWFEKLWVFGGTFNLKSPNTFWGICFILETPFFVVGVYA